MVLPFVETNSRHTSQKTLIFLSLREKGSFRYWCIWPLAETFCELFPPLPQLCLPRLDGGQFVAIERCALIAARAGPGAADELRVDLDVLPAIES